MHPKEYNEGAYRRIRHANVLRAAYAAKADGVPPLRPLHEHLIRGQQGECNPLFVLIGRQAQVRGKAIETREKVLRLTRRRQRRKAREERRQACFSIETD